MKQDSEQPLVSIVIPCYNYGGFLSYTLDNVLQQTYSNWECIVVDDGSVDDSKDVAAKYVAIDKRIKYIYQSNAGLPAARNTGIKNTTGAYIQFLDADDLIAREKIALQVNILENDATADIVYGDARFFHTDIPGKLIKGRDKEANRFQYLKISGSGKQLVKNISINNFIEVSSPLIRRKLVDIIGLFDETYKSYEDWQFWFRAAIAGRKFLYNPAPNTETYIRYGHTSMMTNKRKLVDNGLKIRNYMMPLLPFSLQLYNVYRILKLRIKGLYLTLR